MLAEATKMIRKVAAEQQRADPEQFLGEHPIVRGTTAKGTGAAGDMFVPMELTT